MKLLYRCVKCGRRYWWFNRAPWKDWCSKCYGSWLRWSSSQSGNWSDPETWNSTAVPMVGDTAIISADNTVTVDGSFTLTGGGTLTCSHCGKSWPAKDYNYQHECSESTPDNTEQKKIASTHK